MSRWICTFARTLRGVAAAAAIALCPMVTAPQPAAAQGYQRVSATCGNCFGSVSLNARVGDTCPHCGAVWGAERESYTVQAARRSRRHATRRTQPKHAAVQPRAAATATASINGKQLPAVEHDGKLCVGAREAAAAARARLSGSPAAGRYTIRASGKAPITCSVAGAAGNSGVLPAYVVGGKTYVGLRELCRRLQLGLDFDRQRNRYVAAGPPAPATRMGRR